MEVDRKEKHQDSSNEDAAANPLEATSAPVQGQQLDRNFSLLSICSVGIVTGNVWAAEGGTIVRMSVFVDAPEADVLVQATAIYNGGPPGVIYEL